MPPRLADSDDLDWGWLPAELLHRPEKPLHSALAQASPRSPLPRLLVEALREQGETSSINDIGGSYYPIQTLQEDLECRPLCYEDTSLFPLPCHPLRRPCPLCASDVRLSGRPWGCPSPRNVGHLVGPWHSVGTCGGARIYWVWDRGGPFGWLVRKTSRRGHLGPHQARGALLLLLRGDIELNPGPLSDHWSVVYTTTNKGAVDFAASCTQPSVTGLRWAPTTLAAPQTIGTDWSPLCNSCLICASTFSAYRKSSLPPNIEAATTLAFPK